MRLKMSIRIKNKSIDIPLVQGAMAIGMSSPDLVGGVARRGGIGTLSMVNPGYKLSLIHISSPRDRTRSRMPSSA